MRLLRFHLSTLLALCVGAGALVGLYLTSELWRNEVSLPFNGVPMPEFTNKYPWITSVIAPLTTPISAGSSNRRDVGDFCWVSNDLLERTEAHAGLMQIDTYLYRATGPRELLAKTKIKGLIDWIKYSPDTEQIAVGQPGRISIYRRSHVFGRANLWKQPLFWVAALCILFLLVRFVRYSVGAVKLLRGRKARALVSAVRP
jgi:hypothetical protein